MAHLVLILISVIIIVIIIIIIEAVVVVVEVIGRGGVNGRLFSLCERLSVIK